MFFRKRKKIERLKRENINLQLTINSLEKRIITVRKIYQDEIKELNDKLEKLSTKKERKIKNVN